MGGCTDPGPTDGAGSPSEPSSTTAAPTETVAAPPSARPLVIPGKIAGELARVVFEDGRVEGRIERPATKRPYMTRAACSAATEEASFTFEVRSAEPNRSSQPPFSVAEITCGDSLSQNSGFLLSGRVQIDLVDVDDGVTTAYVVLVPASTP